MFTRLSILLFSGFLSSLAHAENKAIVGRISCNPGFAASWLDTAVPVDLKAGDQLVVSYVGNATTVMVRVAQKLYCDPSTPCGLVRTTVHPIDGIARATIPVDMKGVDHVSLHGGEPWGIVLKDASGQDLVSNGNACLSAVWIE